MSSKQKKIDRFKKIPSDYKENEFTSLLISLGFIETKRKKGRVTFENRNHKIKYHTPHDTGVFKTVYIKQYKEFLENNGYI